MLLGVKREFAEDPCREQKQREDLLDLVLEEYPTGERSNGPEKDGGRAVFFDVEDLANESDGGAGGDGSDGVQGRGHGAEVVADQRTGKMAHRDHGDDECETRAGTQVVPMGGDKQHHAGGEQEAAQDERDNSLPRQASGTLLGFFPGADAGGGDAVENSGGLPAL